MKTLTIVTIVTLVVCLSGSVIYTCANTKIIPHEDIAMIEVTTTLVCGPGYVGGGSFGHANSVNYELTENDCLAFQIEH